MGVDTTSYLKSGSNELRILEYRVCDLSFGINILKVSKIIHDLTQFSKVPEAPDGVTGMFKDRDWLVPVLDLAAFLGLARTKPAERQSVIVTEFFGMKTGFLVDRVDWIHHTDWEGLIDAEKVFNKMAHKYTIAIVKPSEDRMVQLLDYETILLDICPRLRRHEMLVTRETTVDFTGKKVLIAEDSPAVRGMLINELTTCGFEVVETSDGERAWEEFQKQPFDLVISDVEMPQMDGLAFTLRIRQSDRPTTPVIVYSSIGDTGMKARAAYLKADAHITKLNLDQLLETAGKLMSGEKIDPVAEDTGVEESVPEGAVLVES
jgi:two-component system, chemotaxis family, chemotaxis protein CheV